MMHGFYIYIPNKEYFFVTKQTERTEEFCKAVEKYLVEDGCKIGAFSIKEKLQLATCQVRHTADNITYTVITPNINGHDYQRHKDEQRQPSTFLFVS